MRKRILAIFAALGIGFIAGFAITLILIMLCCEIDGGIFSLLLFQLEVYLPICLITSILTQIINRTNGGKTVGLGVGAAGGILVPVIIFGTEIFFTSTELITILYAWVITLPLGYEAGNVTQTIACGSGQAVLSET